MAFKIVDCEQNSPEWYAARIGIPTASCFDRILTPKTGKPSTQWEAYADQILAEEIMGEHIVGYQSPAMLEGQRREAESVAYYEFEKNVDTIAVGFIHDVPRTMGCSPDRLVGDDGILELKNPEAHTQIKYLLTADFQELARDYWAQIQGQLLITGRKWCDIMSYYPHPKMPKQVFRVTRDEDYIGKLSFALQEFNLKLAYKRNELIRLGYIKPNKEAV